MSRLKNAVAVVPPAHDPDWNPYVKRKDGQWYEVNGTLNGEDFGPLDEEFVLEWVDGYEFQIVEREED